MTLSQSLQKSLASTYTLYIKIHSFHWNVTGKRFQELHVFFEEVYTKMWKQTDELAELIRIQGEWAPKNEEQLVKNSPILSEEDIPSDDRMLKILIQDFQTLITVLQETKEAGSGIDAVEDKIPSIISGHEKTLWMLRSMI